MRTTTFVILSVIYSHRCKGIAVFFKFGTTRCGELVHTLRSLAKDDSTIINYQQKRGILIVLLQKHFTTSHGANKGSDKAINLL